MQLLRKFNPKLECGFALQHCDSARQIDGAEKPFFKSWSLAFFHAANGGIHA
jgi:hypothetical protein